MSTRMTAALAGGRLINSVPSPFWNSWTVRGLRTRLRGAINENGEDARAKTRQVWPASARGRRSTQEQDEPAGIGSWICAMPIVLALPLSHKLCLYPIESRARGKIWCWRTGPAGECYSTQTCVMFITVRCNEGPAGRHTVLSTAFSQHCLRLSSNPQVQCCAPCASRRRCGSFTPGGTGGFQGSPMRGASSDRQG